MGKSRLAETFTERTGAPNVYFTASRQGRREPAIFAEEVAASNLPGADLFGGVLLDSWDAALRLLTRALPDDTPSIVVIDELPYLIDADPSFEATLQKQWDRLLSRKPVLLLLIGSDIAMMEALNTHGRAFFQRGTEMIVPPLSPAETGAIIRANGAEDAFDAYLVTGGLPLLCAEWPAGVPMWTHLQEALAEPTSSLIVSAERTLAAELPTEALAREVLGRIGSGEVTFGAIARASGGLHATSAKRALDQLGIKRLIERDVPLSTKPSKETRYRVADPYLRFWLSFLGPHLPELERGRADRVIERVRNSWASWRGRSVEPVVREALRRLLPLKGLEGDAIGGYWTRTNRPEVDIVAADRAPVARRITFTGSIKWHEGEPFDDGDLRALAAATAEVPGAGPDTPLVAVSRSGVSARGASAAFGPDDLIQAWALGGGSRP